MTRLPTCMAFQTQQIGRRIGFRIAKPPSSTMVDWLVSAATSHHGLAVGTWLCRADLVRLASSTAAVVATNLRPSLLMGSLAPNEGKRQGALKLFSAQRSSPSRESLELTGAK